MRVRALFACAAILTLVISACSSSSAVSNVPPPEAGATQLFEQRDFGFTIEHPSTWAVQNATTHGGHGTLAFFSSTETGAGFFVEAGRLGGIELEDYANEIFSANGQLNDMRELNREYTQDGSGIFLTLAAIEGDSSAEARAYVTTANDVGYLVFSIVDRLGVADLKAIDAMFASFRTQAPPLDGEGAPTQHGG